MAEGTAYVQLADGRVGTVPEAEAAQTVASGGRMLTAEEYARAQGGPSSIGDLAMGALDVRQAMDTAFIRGAGAAFGAPTDRVALDAARAVGGSEAQEATRDFLSGLQSRNPIASTAGEIGGSVFGIAVGGKSSIAHEAGVLGETAAARLLGGAGTGSALGRLGRTMALGGARAGAEMVVLGGAGDINEAALGNREITAQKLIAHAPTHFLEGAILGGALSGVGHGAGELVGLGSRRLVAEGAALERRGGELLWNDMAGGSRGTKIARQANEFFPGGAADAARLVREEAAEIAGVARSKVTAETIRELAPEGKARANSGIDSALDAADQAATLRDNRPRLRDIVDELKTYGQENYGRRGARAEMRPFEGMAEDMLATRLPDASPADIRAMVADPRLIPSDATVSLRELRDFRITADGRAKFRPDATNMDQWREVRGLLEGRLLSTMDELAPHLDASIRSKYVSAKKSYQAWTYAEQLGTMAEAAGVTNRASTLTQKLGGMAGSMVGAAAGGGLVGSLVGGAVGNLGARAVQAHYARVVGNAMIDAGRSATVRRLLAATADTDKAIASGVRRFFKAVPAASAAATSRPRERYERVVPAIRNAAGNPAVLADNVATRLRAVAPNAPETVNAIAAQAQQVAQYIAAHMPPANLSPHDLQPRAERPSDGAISRFLAIVDAAVKPLSILDDLRSGRITPEAAKTVRDLYPAVFDQVRREVMNQIHEATVSGHAIPYTKRVQLGVLFGMPTDRTMAPEFMAWMQNQYAAPSSQPASPPAGGTPMPHIAEDLKTATQRAGD